MEITDLQNICTQFPAVTIEIKWKSDLVFSIGNKIFCILDLEGPPHAVSYKVPGEKFEEISNQMHFRPAPYFGRYHWVMIDNMNKMGIRQWEKELKTSYDLVKEKLSPKMKRDLNL